MEEYSESLEFQRDCISEVLDKYEISHERFVNDLIGFYFDLFENIPLQKNGDELISSLLEEIGNDNNDRILSILAETKVKVFQMENSPLWREFNENRQT